MSAYFDELSQATTIKQWIEDSMAGYSPKQLNEAFAKVSNKTNWKLPIDTVVEKADIKILTAAIPFFCGSVPMFTPVEGGKVRVEADGYYADIGA